MMSIKLRLDNDLYQRILLLLAASLPLFYLLPYSLYFLLVLLLMVAIILATLKSSLQLEPDGKSVLVTGCDTGFGLALSKHLAGLGFKVFSGCLLADKNGPGAEELRGLQDPNIKVLQLDVTKAEDWDKAHELIKENLGASSPGLWGIVNNAGWATFGEVEWVNMATYRKAVDVNVLGLIQGVKVMLPLIRRAKGRVVTITSGLGRMAVPTRSPYVTTKYALEGFLDCLRYEMKPFGVGVSILEPGNFIAGTNIFNQQFVTSQADYMWGNMTDEVKNCYGKEYFDSKVATMAGYMKGGIADISPVINSYTDALLDVYPQARYQPMNLKFKIQCFVATHLPEAVYEWCYIGRGHFK